VFNRKERDLSSGSWGVFCDGVCIFWRPESLLPHGLLGRSMHLLRHVCRMRSPNFPWGHVRPAWQQAVQFSSAPPRPHISPPSILPSPIALDPSALSVSNAPPTAPLSVVSAPPSTPQWLAVLFDRQSTVGFPSWALWELLIIDSSVA
jgi:hypothetical protein